MALRANQDSARQLRQGRKKRLNAALDELAETGRSTDETIIEYLLAQHINTACKGNVIAPWQVRNLPERYVTAAIGLNTQTERRRKLEKAKRQLDTVFSNWRNQHPAYKHLTH